MDMHDYTDPLEGSSQLASGPKSTSLSCEASSSQESFKEATTSSPYDVITSQPKRSSPFKLPIRHKCRYCLKTFTNEKNPKGSCRLASDPVYSAMRKATLMCCVDCAMYHFASDDEGDVDDNPCNCTRNDTCTRRWACLSFLACCVPCLWFYPPLKLCHWCGVKCRVCGARHEEIVYE